MIFVLQLLPKLESALKGRRKPFVLGVSDRHKIEDLT